MKHDHRRRATRTKTKPVRLNEFEAAQLALAAQHWHGTKWKDFRGIESDFIRFLIKEYAESNKITVPPPNREL